MFFGLEGKQTANDAYALLIEHTVGEDSVMILNSKTKYIISLCVLLMIGCGEEEQDSAPEPANVNANPGGGSSNTRPGLGEVCVVPDYSIGEEEPCQGTLGCYDLQRFDSDPGDTTFCRQGCSQHRDCQGIGPELCVKPHWIDQDYCTLGHCALSNDDLYERGEYPNFLCENIEDRG